MVFLKRNRTQILILVFIFVAHLTYIDNGFTWLDHGDIEEKRAVLPLSKFPTAFTSRYGETGYYRPLVTLVHSIDFAIYRNWAPGYHLTNVLLHLEVSVVAGLFLHHFIHLTSKEKNVTILIVGLAPISWFTVGTISNLQELLVGLFTLLTVTLHIVTRYQNNSKYIGVTLLCFGLALLSKETALFWVPVIILLWEWGQTNVRRHIKMNFPLFIGETIALMIYLLFHLRFVPEVWKSAGVTLRLTQAIGTRLSALGLFLFKLISPLQPSVSDATHIVELTHPNVFVTIVVLGGGLLLVRKYGLRSVWGRTLALLGILFFPALNIVPLPRFSSTHYGYVVTVGIAGVVVLILRTLAKYPSLLTKVAWGAVTIWLVVAAGSTFLAGHQHRNDFTLFSPEVVKDPDFREGHFYLGNYYFARNEIANADREYTAALAQTPGIIAYVDKNAAVVNFAGVLMAENRLDEAQTLLSEALDRSPATNQQAVTYNLALLYMKKGDYQKVVELLNNPSLKWQKPEALLMLAEALYKLERKEEAISVLRHAEALVTPEQKSKLELLIQNLEAGKL